LLAGLDVVRGHDRLLPLARIHSPAVELVQMLARKGAFLSKNSCCYNINKRSLM
jgi:hypothetical protein